MKQFAAYAPQELERNPVPGLALAVADHGQIAYEFTHGFRNVEDDLPATASTRFGIGSITKSFTALALMQLGEAGKLMVDDPVVRYLPLRFPGAERITIHHLLTHSAGLPMLGTEMYAANDHTGRPPLDPLGSRGVTAVRSTAELIELLNELEFKPIAPPGAVMSYSNDGFALLGAVVEATSGRSWREYVTSQIIEPLGLTDTVFGAFDRMGGGTRRYTVKKEPDGTVRFEPGPGDLEVMPMASAGGGPQLSTVRDLVRYFEVYRNLGEAGNVRLASEASIRRMLTPYLQVRPNEWYGYALSLRTLPNGETLIGHGGGDLGVSAYVGFLPGRGITLAAQCNAGSNVVERLCEAALREIGGADPTTDWAPQPVPASAADLERWVGTYASERVGAKWRILLDGATVKVDVDGKVCDAEPVAGGGLRVQMAPGEAWVIMRAVDAAGNCYGIRVGARVLTPAG